VTPSYVTVQFDRLYNVELDCSDEAEHDDVVSWSKDGRELHESTEYSMQNNGAVLTVRHVTANLAGRYQCRVVDGTTGDVTGSRHFVIVEAGLCVALRECL